MLLLGQAVIGSDAGEMSVINILEEFYDYCNLRDSRYSPLPSSYDSYHASAAGLALKVYSAIGILSTSSVGYRNLLQ